jgi:hypothetical protein
LVQQSQNIDGQGETMSDESNGMVKHAEEILKSSPLQLDTRFGKQVPTERRFGINTQQRHISYEMLKDQMPELNEFMPDRISLNTLYKMRRDPMIQLGLHFIKVPLTNARWKIEGPDEQEAAFLTWCTEQIWQKLLTSMLLSLEFGFSGIIKRWKLGRPPESLGLWNNTIDAIIPDDAYALPPSLIVPRFTKDGKFNGIEYYGSGTGKKDIPDEYVMWFTHDLEASFGNLYGFPRIGYGYPYWRSYWFRWLLYDRHFEQDADPPLIIWGPSGTYETEDGSVRSYRDDGLALAEQLRSGAGIYLPSTPYIDARTDAPTQAKQWDVRFEYGGHNIEGFQSTFEYLDVMKLRAILVPEQALVEGKGGTSSRNVAATYGAAFADSQSVLMKYLDAAFNEFYLDKLAFYNFGSPAGTYKKTTDSFLQENGDLMGEIIKAVAGRDPLAAGVNIKEVAKQLQFPMLTEEEEAALKEEKKAEMEDQMQMLQREQNIKKTGSEDGGGKENAQPRGNGSSPARK